MRKLVIGIALVCLCAGMAAAQEKKEAGLSTWFKDMQRKLEKVMPKKTMPMTTGVAGVRGAKGDSQTKLYWKGKKGDEPVSEAELIEFRTALELAEKGDTAMAVHELEEFLAQFPDSPLVPDVKKTLDLVKAEGKQ